MIRIAGLILLMLPLFAAADVVVPVDSVENHVNIRMSPDSASEIVGRLNQGDFLTLVDSIAEWHEVEISGGATGFISADWTVVLDEPPSVSDDVEVVAEVADAGSETPDETVEDVPEIIDVEDIVEEQPVVSDDEVIADAEAKSAVDSDELVQEEGVEAVQQTAEAEDAIEAVTEDASTKSESDDMTSGVAGEAAEEEQSGAEQVVAEEVVVEEEAIADEIVAEDAQETKPAIPVLPDEVPDEDSGDVHEVPPTPTADTETAKPGPQGLPGLPGLQGPQGEIGPQGPAGAANIEGAVGFLAKFTAPTTGGTSQLYDDGNNIGIGTTEPKQRLEVNGNIQIHERNSSVAGLMITQSDGDTGYIMHNRASTLTIGAGSVDRITIDREGNVGFGVARPRNPLEMASGAHVTAGGVWTNSSSRARKENIAELSLDDALSTLAQLEPVQFNYKNDQAENYVGFIAEDVPELVATTDRDGLSTMDIVAVLTRVVQQQQKKIKELEARLDQR